MMQQLFATEPYLLQSKEVRLTDNIFRNWLSIAPRQTQISEFFETEKDIVNSIKNMSAEMASLKEALSINNELLKATNDLLLQITASLSIFEAQSYFWTEEWQKGEGEATKDIERGDVYTFDDVEELIQFLDSPSQ